MGEIVGGKSTSLSVADTNNWTSSNLIHVIIETICFKVQKVYVCNVDEKKRPFDPSTIIYEWIWMQTCQESFCCRQKRVLFFVECINIYVLCE